MSGLRVRYDGRLPREFHLHMPIHRRHRMLRELGLVAEPASGTG
jgi:hypothetical protein